MVSSTGASGETDDRFNSTVVKSLVAAIVLSVDVGTGMTTLDGNQVRVSVKRKYLVLVMCTVYQR